jgi:hypothetical protein
MNVLLSRRRVGLGQLVTGIVLGFLEIIGFITVVNSSESLVLSTAGVVGAVLWPVGGYLLMRPSGSKSVVLAGLGLLISVHVIQLVIHPSAHQSEQLVFVAILTLYFLSGVVAR